ncbi:MAG: phosphoribosyl-ATP diphosphatase [bacterium]|jgi:phosphoribosyl-ATP pyrophosphohydrolase
MSQLIDVYETIQERQRSGSPEASYVSKLTHKGLNAILKKVGEEATEVVLAAKDGDRQGQIHEITDLVFHLLVLMAHQGISPKDIDAELQRRHGKSGLVEKAERSATS